MPKKPPNAESLAELVARFDPAVHGGEFPQSVTALKGLIPRPERPVDVAAMRPYTLDELLAQCDPDAPMPDELRDWEAAPPVGREFGAVRTLPVSRVRRELVSIIRRGETVLVSRRGRAVVVLGPTLSQPPRHGWAEASRKIRDAGDEFE
jgi:antitoxin ChpS